MTRILSSVLVLLAGLWSPAVFAQAGTALGVDPDASSVNKGITKTLVVGSDVQVGERIVTGSRGLVQILFSDATRLVVGPGSSLIIEQYLLRGSETADKLTVNALSGTFRFATGRSPKPAYEIKTPTATIGVRGTGFDLNVTQALTRAIVSHGEINLCQGGQCVIIGGQCAAGQVDTNEAQRLRLTQQAIMSLRPEFPMLVNQNPLLRPFRFDRVNQCLDAATPEPTLAELPEVGEPPEVEPCDCNSPD